MFSFSLQIYMAVGLSPVSMGFHLSLCLSFNIPLSVCQSICLCLSLTFSLLPCWSHCSSYPDFFRSDITLNLNCCKGAFHIESAQIVLPLYFLCYTSFGPCKNLTILLHCYWNFRERIIKLAIKITATVTSLKVTSQYYQHKYATLWTFT